MRPLTRLGLARGIGFTAVFLVFPFVFTEPWVVNIAIFTVMYAALATAWNILGGFSGYLSLGHAAFFGIGAYAEAIVFQHIGIGGGYRPFVVLPAVGFGVAVAALPIAWVARAHAGGDVRHRHDLDALHRPAARVQPALAHQRRPGPRDAAAAVPGNSTFERPFYLAMVAVWRAGRC